ncbi:hypothetical protein [Selenihalanaerobacter shriftii]|uniref:Uncharacterized protein n=1 Tax=Selenihalanaerobacter shriftii TaxID=142842 RepID=A0A1T4LH26_9FIRM|nr:hypothetical protein [Selenihalanaerobacter shriftii]SJZ53881.1 hypothetical protein SAMN02745118_01130 [Selenihalanaerobacter shriftii]
MWIKKRISKYRFSRIGSYQRALNKTLKIFQKKYGKNKVFLTNEKDSLSNNHLFLKANLKQDEIESFHRTYNQVTNMFFAGKHNQEVSI